MKKRTILIFLMITAALSGAFPQAYEPMEIQAIPVKMEELHMIPVGSGDFELGYLYEDIQGGITTSPRDLLVTKDSIYLYDEYNRRMVAFSRDFSEFKNLKSPFQSDIYSFIDGNHEYLISSGGVYSLAENKVLIDWEGLAYGRINPEDGVLSPDNFSFVDERYLIFADRYKKEIILLDLKLDNSTFESVMYDGEAEQYLNNNSGDIGVIENRYILNNGTLITKSALTFMRFFKETNSQINYNDEEMGDYLTDYCGIDADGNYYWNAYDRQVFIFDDNGNFIIAIQAKIDSADTLLMRNFSIDSDGNLYNLAIDEDQENFKLLRIERDW